MENESKVMVTRHKALVEYAREIGLIDEDTPIVEHATVGDVIGKRVIGVLPLSLASFAESITEIGLNLTPDDRGKELPIERIREIARGPVTYEVRKLDKRRRLSKGELHALLKG